MYINIFRKHLLSTQCQLPVAGANILSFATAGCTATAIQTSSVEKIHLRIDVQRFEKKIGALNIKEIFRFFPFSVFRSLVLQSFSVTRTHTDTNITNICSCGRSFRRSVRSLYSIQICSIFFFLRAALEAMKPYLLIIIIIFFRSVFSFLVLLSKKWRKNISLSSQWRVNAVTILKYVESQSKCSLWCHLNVNERRATHSFGSSFAQQRQPQFLFWALFFQNENCDKEWSVWCVLDSLQTWRTRAIRLHHCSRCSFSRGKSSTILFFFVFSKASDATECECERVKWEQGKFNWIFIASSSLCFCCCFYLEQINETAHDWVCSVVAVGKRGSVYEHS